MSCVHAEFVVASSEGLDEGVAGMVTLACVLEWMARPIPTVLRSARGTVALTDRRRCLSVRS